MILTVTEELGEETEEEEGGVTARMERSVRTGRTRMHVSAEKCTMGIEKFYIDRRPKMEKLEGERLGGQL